MFNSKKYWNNRYKNGGNSGPGSYNILAKFKAEIINNFINKNKIESIIDYGVGDGNQLKLIDTTDKNYTGIDVSHFIINKCRKIFKDDKTKNFFCEGWLFSKLFRKYCCPVAHLEPGETG